MRCFFTFISLLTIAGMIAIASFAQTPEIEAKLKEKEDLKKQMEEAGPEEYQKLLPRWETLNEEIANLMNALQADKETKAKAIAKFNDGNDAIRARRYLDAVNLFKESIKLNSLEPKTYYMLGLALQRLKEYDEALEAYTKATQLDSKYLKALTARGLLLSKMQRLDEAIEAFRQAAAIEDDDPKDKSDAFNGLGLAYYRQKNYERAINAYQQAVLMDSTNAEAHYNLGKAYMSISDPASATEAFQKAVKYESKDDKYQTSLAEAFNKAGKYAEAVQAALAATLLNANYAPAWFELGWAYEQLKKSEDAINAYQKAMNDSKYRQAAEYQIKLIKGEF